MSAEHHEGQDQGVWWIARHENANKVFYSPVFVCAFLVVFDLIYTGINGKEGHFRFERVVAFHAIYLICAKCCLEFIGIDFGSHDDL